MIKRFLYPMLFVGLVLLFSFSGLMGLSGGALADDSVCEPISNSFNIQQMQYLTCYESELGAAPIMMDFTSFPTMASAVAMGNQMANLLNTWRLKNAEPLIVMEPTLGGNQNDLMNLYSFESPESSYDQALKVYFQTIHNNTAHNITDKEMGIWVPFPEPNMPGWYDNDTSPSVFKTDITNFTNILNENFPATPVSVMLNSQTAYMQGSAWVNDPISPEYVLPYVTGIKSGLISSFGLQGFTWDNTDNAETFLMPAEAIDCAKALGVSDVWFNTGTYSKVYNPNGQGIIKAGSARRAQILNEVIAVVKNVQSQGLTVDYINLFAQNTYNDTLSSANYSYNTKELMRVLGSFIQSAAQIKIPVAVFNAEGN